MKPGLNIMLLVADQPW